jgi:hypothetical protein
MGYWDPTSVPTISIDPFMGGRNPTSVPTLSIDPFTGCWDAANADALEHFFEVKQEMFALQGGQAQWARMLQIWGKTWIILSGPR